MAKHCRFIKYLVIATTYYPQDKIKMHLILHVLYSHFMMLACLVDYINDNIFMIGLSHKICSIVDVRYYVHCKTKGMTLYRIFMITVCLKQWRELMCFIYVFVSNVALTNQITPLKWIHRDCTDFIFKNWLFSDHTVLWSIC